MPAPAGPLTEPPRVLLTLDLAGRKVRLADRTISVTDSFGRSHLYTGGLPKLDVSEEAPFLGVGRPSDLEIQVATSLDLTSLRAQHWLPDEATGELALYRAGDLLEQRYIVRSGTVRVGGSGQSGQPLRLTLSAYDPASDQSVYPTDEMVMNDKTWTSSSPARTFDPAADGAPYPTVFGYSGIIRKSGSVANVPASPVYLLSVNSAAIVYAPAGHPVPTTGTYWFIAGHPFCEGSDGRVTVWQGTATSDWLYLYYARDALGRLCTVAKKIGTTLPTAFGSGPFHATATSGGIIGNKGGPMENAGEILRFAMEQSGVLADWRRIGPVLQQLGGFRLAGMWDEPCNPWQWAVDNLFPLLPVSAVVGPDGVYPVFWQWYATAEHAICHLTDGLNCSIEGDIKEEGEEDVRSSIALDFGKGLISDGGVWRKRRTWAPTSDSVPVSESLHNRRSGLRWPTHTPHHVPPIAARSEILSSDLVYRDDTADHVLAWRSQVYSQPRGIVRVTGSGLHGDLGHLVPGDVVTLTSSSKSLTRRVGHVRRAGWLGAMAYADIMLLSQT